MYKIGDFANIFNISIKTIRFYEEKGLIVPKFVDIYSGYRYFDEENVKQMIEILALKNLGFSLDEIKNFNVDKIPQKIKDLEAEIMKMQEKVANLKNIALHGKENLKMEKFINDERAIGKWRLLGVAENFEQAKKEIFKEDDFIINELYFLPNGEPYWVIRWTKGSIFTSGQEYKYVIEGNKLYLTITSSIDSNDQKIAVYELVDNKKHTIEDIRIKDDINKEFVPDDAVVGSWKTVDFVGNPNSFNPMKPQCAKDNLSLEKLVFNPEGEIEISFKGNENPKYSKYTKDYIINLVLPDTLSKYEYQEIDHHTYLIVEWKSGDYVFGKMISGYYVLEKE